MIGWIISGIFGAIIVFLLFVLRAWKIAFRGAKRHQYNSSSWIVYEKDGWVDYTQYWEERSFLPPKRVRTRVVRPPKEDQSDN